MARRSGTSSARGKRRERNEFMLIGVRHWQTIRRAGGYKSERFVIEPRGRYRVPEDIPFDIAAQALRDGFAEKATGSPRVEQKNAAQAD